MTQSSQLNSSSSLWSIDLRGSGSQNIRTSPSTRALVGIDNTTITSNQNIWSSHRRLSTSLPISTTTSINNSDKMVAGTYTSNAAEDLVSSYIQKGSIEVEVDMSFGLLSQNSKQQQPTLSSKRITIGSSMNMSGSLVKEGGLLTPVSSMYDLGSGSDIKRTPTTATAWPSNTWSNNMNSSNSPSTTSSIWDKAQGGMVTASPLTSSKDNLGIATPPSDDMSGTYGRTASNRTSISFGYGSSDADEEHVDDNAFKHIRTQQPLRDTSDNTSDRFNPQLSKTSVIGPARVRSKSFNAGYEYIGEELLYDGSSSSSKNLAAIESAFPDSLLWGDDRVGSGIHRRASTVPSAYQGLWDAPTTTTSLMGRASSPAMEDSSLQYYYRQGRRFSHAPTLYQDWHDPRVNRTGALEQDYDLQHLSPSVLDTRRRHSLAGPPMYPSSQPISPARYLNEALESLHLEDGVRENLQNPFPLRPSSDYNAPTPLRSSKDYYPISLRSNNNYLRDLDDSLNHPHIDPALIDAPLYDEINDYFENTEHRTRAWVEAGKNLQMQTNHPIHWPLYIVEFKAGRMGYFYVGENNGMTVRKGDLIIVEADRGKDLGKVVLDGIQNPQQLAMHQSLLGDGLLSGVNMSIAGVGMGMNNEMVGGVIGAGSQGAVGGAMVGPGVAGQLGPLHPKRIYRIAQPSEINQLVAKSADEAKARALCQAKIRQRKLSMEIVDAEYQWDRRKLTFYFVADRRIDFRELVRELFKIYKTRIWMCAVSPIGCSVKDLELAGPPAYI